LIEAIARCTKKRGQLLALVKPQFEVGREEASKSKGVVRDEKIRAAAIERVAEEVRAAGFRVLGQRDSTLAGPSGNVEAFIWAERT
jgi:23S rRNA (cytidine1920-2'-O)/16S rRNA (cytidine1409-2'-O)-methyltransferase